MTAFFVAQVTVKDGEKFQAYAQAAGQSMQPFGGEVVLKGKANTALAGKLNHQNTGIVKFPDMAALNEWYNSDAYQKLIPMRDEAADISITTYSAV